MHIPYAPHHDNNDMPTSGRRSEGNHESELSTYSLYDVNV
jgi:hypothetical protein